MHRAFKLVFSFGFLAIILIFILSAVAAYRGPDGQFSAGLLRYLSLPIALSGSHIVTVTGLETSSSGKLGSRADLSKALKEYHRQNTLGDLLADLEFKEAKCSEFELNLEACLHLVWVSNSVSKTHALADELVEKIFKGDDFAVLAAQYSHDEATKVFGGDAGFVNPENTLPEFGESLTAIKSGAVAVIPSRHGLHVVKVDDVIVDAKTEARLFRVHEIFLPVEGFDKWLTDSLSASRMVSFVD